MTRWPHSVETLGAKSATTSGDPMGPGAPLCDFMRSNGAMGFGDPIDHMG